MDVGKPEFAEEQALLAALRHRRPEACEAFVDAHYGDVYRLLLWLCGQPETAADLTQETFAAFWRSLAELDKRTIASLRPWLFAIARNRWRKRCRDHHPTQPLEEALELGDPAPGPEAQLLQALDRELLSRLVLGLPVDLREALVLRVFQELSYREIGEMTGVADGLARWRVHRARTLLRMRALEAMPEWQSTIRESGKR
jgi:RNA polymerase sigma-70 factor (ECF subfamily)